MLQAKNSVCQFYVVSAHLEQLLLKKATFKGGSKDKLAPQLPEDLQKDLSPFLVKIGHKVIQKEDNRPSGKGQLPDKGYFNKKDNQLLLPA